MSDGLPQSPASAECCGVGRTVVSRWSRLVTLLRPVDTPLPAPTIGYPFLHPHIASDDFAGDEYSDALAWLYSRQSLGIEPGLARIEALLASIGNPHVAFRSVHIAGTNGKGSVSAMLSRALALSGHRTGLYTSPHLVSFRERIRIDGVPISRPDTARLTNRLRAVANDLDRSGLAPTFFELCTALAFAHFAEQGVSWAVVEAGMGGGLDATNVLEPALAVITNVTRDHTAFLGDDVRDIAAEKAGIAKSGVPVVTASEGIALEVIERLVSQRGGVVIAIGDDYRVDPGSTDLVISDDRRQRRFEVGMAGAHQLCNAAIVVAACDLLLASGEAIDSEALRQALADTLVPGRLESLETGGIEVLIDGAHNLAAAEAITSHLAGSDYDLVVGFSRDKEWPEMLQSLASVARRVWGVPIRSPRSLDPYEMAGALPDGIPFEAAADFSAAWERILHSRPERVLVTGSLFLAGEARAVLTGADLSEVGGSQ